MSPRDHKVSPQSTDPVHLYTVHIQLAAERKHIGCELQNRVHSVLIGSRKKLNYQITTFLSKQQIPLFALPFSLPPIFNFLHILRPKRYLLLPPTYLCDLPLPILTFLKALLLWQKCCSLGIQLLSATKHDKVGPSPSLLYIMFNAREG